MTNEKLQTLITNFQRDIREHEEELKELRLLEGLLQQELHRRTTGEPVHQVELTFYWMQPGVKPSVRQVELTDEGIRQCQKNPDLAAILCDVTAWVKEIGYNVLNQPNS